MFIFFNDTAPTEIYTLSLHDALPISEGQPRRRAHPHLVAHVGHAAPRSGLRPGQHGAGAKDRSEEHTSELQSRQYLVCRLLLEKKKNLLVEVPHTVCYDLLHTRAHTD